MENAKLKNAVLSPENLTCFEQNGYVYLPKAFSRGDALAIQDSFWSQMQEQGIDRDDRSTWPTDLWPSLKLKDNPSLESRITTPRLCGAINQLLGSNNWHVPHRWGGYLISFPTGIAQDWELTSQAWHWDDTLINHFGQCNTGLFIFTFYSDVQAKGGGTLVVSGSHRLIEQFFHRLSPKDQRLKQKALKRQFAQSQPWLAELTGLTSEYANRTQRFMEETTEVDGVPVKVIEVTGDPGDAYLCHPAIYHARSPNHAEVPRFMRVKGLVKQTDPSI
ncbi:MAG: phytanoyl-CoA dioxygenase family protein [Chloroflexota bacterium]